ncbi:MAG: hypothetical protein HN738_17955 [Gammaproteobacteria bacterium]|jgi:DNA polymerase III epsilon subunit-like protein|nr:hypothetical protein [Gammaproteobacteria bacterium]MBT5722441.1 hypothetical protein [Gammaproteobacteria bacterium]MBT6891844.1 hypothetical protein [Gammaproteobacteria bacterium]MBT7879962.1 hypothetical protein [Gammaproteobacteria bacterium]
MKSHLPRICLLATLLLTVLSIQAKEIPKFVEALGRASVAVSTPAGVPEDWLLAHVDVETTGLVPGFHEMIDFGLIITDLEGRELDRLFLRIMPDHPERAQPGAVRVNGFSVELWQQRGFISTSEAVDEIAAFHRKIAGDRNVLFVGYNAWFDISFVDHLFRSSGRTWRELYHYFVLDLPSMAWSLGIRDLAGQKFVDKLGIEPETTDPLEHTGITGAQANVNVYRALLKVQAKAE